MNTSSGISQSDKKRLTHHLNIIANSSDWAEDSAKAASSILSKAEYTYSDWEQFFYEYFHKYYFTDSLRNYIDYPVFWWFDQNIHLKLQTALINPLIQKSLDIISANYLDLGRILEHNVSLRQTLFNCHRFFMDIANHGITGKALNEKIFNYHASLIDDYYPHIFKSAISINPDTYPHVPVLKALIWMVVVDLFPERNDRIADIIGLSEKRKDIWNDFSVLVIDNKGLDSAQLGVMYDYFSKIPPELPLPRIVTVNEFLGSERHFYNCYSGINISGSRVGMSSENGFPDDVLPGYTDIFSLILAHEANHVVNSHYINVEASKSLNQKKSALIHRAGCGHQSYLRSMFEDCFFENAPQEFFPSISNQWFSDSAHTLELGIARFLNFHPEPINQVLFFADVYSCGTDITYFYEMDTEGKIRKHIVPIGRENGRIDLLIWKNTAYRFNLDGDGFVRDIDIEEGTAAISGQIKDSQGRGIEGVVIEFTNRGGIAATGQNGFYTQVVSQGWSGKASVSKAGYTFSPTERSYSNVNSDNINQDYTATRQADAH